MIMDMKILFVIFAVSFAGAYGLSSPTLSLQYTLYSQQSNDNDQLTNSKDSEDLSNYAISRNRLGNEVLNNGGYGHYNYGNYPSGPGYPGNYPGGQYPGGQYPGGHYPGHHPGPAGPPGAHPGCPLCDSSVYSYCSRKQAHDSCCCNSGGFSPFGCDKGGCKFLYANSCQEHQLITNCCCVDLYKDGGQAVVA